MNPQTKASLQKLFKPDQILFDQPSLQQYGRDWVKHFDPNPLAVVFPKETKEVQALVDWARTHKTALVPSGGRTGLSGAAAAVNHEVVVSFEKMNRILDFDPTDRIVTCEAGVITEALQKYVSDLGYYFPVDFAARGSSHIGGNIATNAGGIKVIRYGLMRDWIAGLEVVTGRGEILELNRGLVKNATGLDLRHLMIGSEGTLGFITKAQLRVTAPPKPLSVVLLAVADLDSVMKIFADFRNRLPLTAFEFFSDIALKHVLHQTGLKSPLNTKSENYLLVEIENTDASVQDEILACFESAVERGWVLDGAFSQSESQSREFWRLREDISEATAAYMPYKNDVSVKISKVPEFLRDVDRVLKSNYPDFEVVWFGHIGDGNMHINVLKPARLDKEEFLRKCRDVNRLLFEKIQEHGGSISAEHGVGLVKKPYLNLTRNLAEIELMRQIKRAFDPDLILNPGKIFDT